MHPWHGSLELFSFSNFLLQGPRPYSIDHKYPPSFIDGHRVEKPFGEEQKPQADETDRSDDSPAEEDST